MTDPNTLVYDETGMLALLNALEGAQSGGGDPKRAAGDALPVADLNGSWYLQLVPEGPHQFVEIRGPLRIEAVPPRLRVSGDIYVNVSPPPLGQPLEILSPVPPAPLVIGSNWYPQLPFEQYAWYFRSRSAVYANGVLTMTFYRRVWDHFIPGLKPHEREFLPADNLVGTLILNCPVASAFSHPRLPNSPTLRVTGTLQIGETRYSVVATKSSPLHRGCQVAVEVMENRHVHLETPTCQGILLSYVQILKEEGSMDIALTHGETPFPEQAELTLAEMDVMMENSRRPAPGKENQWLLWLLIGSRWGGVSGLMFDYTKPPYRQGLAVFWDHEFAADDARLAPDCQGKPIGKVPMAFLRTLLHETGHAFNLRHPKDDIQVIPAGVTLMNQTRDVIGFAVETNLFPCCAAFHFDEHHRMSLIHAPDPQIAPGWKQSAWGNGRTGGVQTPTDALGMVRHSATTKDFELILKLPERIFRGEFVTARFALRNVSNATKTVTVALNLAQGDMNLLVTPPTGQGAVDARDLIVACGNRGTFTLAPNETVEGVGQIFYTSLGHTFRHLGRYYVSAELSFSDPVELTVQSPPYVVLVRAPRTPTEAGIAQITMDRDGGTGLGQAFALGDFGSDTKVRADLERLATEFGGTDTGRAAAFVLANALKRPLHDLRTNDTPIREAETEAAERAFWSAAATLVPDPEKIAVLALAVASPIEVASPVLDFADRYLVKPPEEIPPAFPLLAGTEVFSAPESGDESALEVREKAFREARTLLDKLRQTFSSDRRA